MSEDRQEITTSKSPETTPDAAERTKKKHLELYQKAVQVAQNEYETPETTSDDEVKTVEHKRRLLAKQVGSLLIKQSKQSEAEVAEAIRDGEINTLTHIYNRKGFTRRLVEEKARIERARFIGQNTNSILIYFDANGLKEINDRTKDQHSEGDKYLQSIALAISEVARPNDVVARIGGDEFALIMPTASYGDARDFWTNRLLPTLIGKGVSVSAGSALINPDDIDQSIKNADVAMYEAKKFSKVYGTNEYKEHGENIK